MSRPTAPQAPVIVWFRRDLRLADNLALLNAARTGRPVIPLFILDETEGLRAAGAASRWWLDKSLAALARTLEACGSRLVLRRGEAAQIIEGLIRDTGATRVVWNRLYDPDLIDRDTRLKAALRSAGAQTESFSASLLTEPWLLKTKAGAPFKVFTPFWRTLRSEIAAFTLHSAPTSLPAPDAWPASDDLGGWGLHPRKPDWSGGFADWSPGEAGAHARLGAFLERRLAAYPTARDVPGVNGTSNLSPHLHWGEIGPRQVWRAAEGAAHHHPALASAAEKFLSELAWRDFNHQLLFHHPDMQTANFKQGFDGFPWRSDPAGLSAWKRGQTGYPMVDAGMRQLWTTGFMHNRVRMIAASFLIKHLLIDWREGERWFWDTLVDADEANNTGNWQWVAGSGADAAPFFRIFSPMGQGERFDPQGDYVQRWVPELAGLDPNAIHAPWKAPPEQLQRAGVVLGQTYPKPIVDHDFARNRALEALKSLKG